MKIAKVIVEYSAYEVDRVFDYLVSDEMSVSKGCRVYIYFNNRKIIGYVLDVYETNKTKEELEEEFGFTLRYIDSVIDTESLLDDELTSLAFYMQKEYFAPLISCFQTMLPKNLKPQSVKKVKPLTRDFLIVNDKITPSLTPKQQELYDFVKNEKEVLRSSLD
ncbi:TPA: primosomal protein N', partial [bacterium]|nr:primosomal protein N' [bacterium]